jgi:hypothetical protein
MFMETATKPAIAGVEELISTLYLEVVALQSNLTEALANLEPDSKDAKDVLQVVGVLEGTLHQLEELPEPPPLFLE